MNPVIQRSRFRILRSHLPIGPSSAIDPGLLKESRLSSRLQHGPGQRRNLEKGITGAMSCLRDACWDRAAPADSSAQVIPRIRWRTLGIRGKLLGKNTLYNYSQGFGKDTILQAPVIREPGSDPCFRTRLRAKWKFSTKGESSIFPYMEESNLSNRLLYDYIRGAHTLEQGIGIQRLRD